MTLAQLYTEISGNILHRPTLADATLLAQINIVHAELQRGLRSPFSAERVYWRCQKMTSGSITYPALAASVAVATDCRKVRRVRLILDDGGLAPIEGTSEETLERLKTEKAMTARAGGGSLRIGTKWYPASTNSVGIYPVPQDACAIEADYYRVLPDYNPTATPAVTTDWFLENTPLVLAYGAAGRLAQGQRDMEFAGICLAEFQRLLVEALDADAEEAAGESSSVYCPPLRGSRYDR